MVIRSSFVEQMARVVTKKRQQPTSTTSFSTVVEQLLRRNAQSSASNETSTDERVQAIRAKLDSGKTLTPSELLYIRLNDPQQLSAIEQTMRERRMMEMMMRMARTKTDVDMAVVRTSSAISQSSMSREQKDAMQKHLKDVQKNYEQSEEYAQKPDSPLDERHTRSTKRVTSYADVLRAYR